MIKMLLHFFVLALSLQLGAGLEGQKPLRGNSRGPLDAKFGSLVNETLNSWHVPGFSIAVIDGDDIWAEGYGIAQFPDTPVTPSTLFYAGSTTKAFTAAAMSLLIDENKIQWDTPVSKIIRDDFVLESAYATEHTTIEDSLSHRSGMPRHDLSYGGKYDGHEGTSRDVVRALRFLPLTAEPRTTYQYCNMMYVAAAHVIETLTEMWLGDFLRERIWKPLGMKSTYFSNEDAIKAPETFAIGYVYYENNYTSVPYLNLSVLRGAGSVISNVLDYSKWIKALIDLSGPISKIGHKALKTPRTLSFDDPGKSPYIGASTYSLGWEINLYKGHQVIQHSGGTDSFGANVLFFPDLKYGIVSFANTAGTSNAVEEILMWHLVDEKLGIPKNERFDWSKLWIDRREEREQGYKNAINIHYPSVPSPPLAPSLPISQYSGIYYHPAFRNVTVELRDDALFINRTDAVWKYYMTFKHISGDYFLGYMDSAVAPRSIFKSALPAEFKVGSDGTTKLLGIATEPEMGPEGRIWFERVG